MYSSADCIEANIDSGMALTALNTDQVDDAKNQIKLAQAELRILVEVLDEAE